MRIYLRRLTAHDMNKEINITKEVFYNFFDESEKISIICKNSNLEYEVGMNYGQISRSPDGMPQEFRFDSKIKDAIKSEQGFDEGTIVVIKKMSQNYELEVVLKNDKSYDRMASFFENNKNHTLIEIDDDNVEVITTKFKRNRIIFGAPGTGKSFKLNNEKNELVGDNEGQYERVTFHPDYTYANFVGTYKPVMINSNGDINQNDKEIIEVLNDKSISAQEKYDKLYDKFKDDNSLTRLSILIGLYDGGDFVARKADGSDAAKSSVEKNHGKAIKPYVNLINNNTNSNISYKYIPGPFMRLFVKALLNPDKPYLLLIEEINRANVAAVFGDLFQLLDRDDNEESEYPVEASEDIQKYLKEYGLERNKIKIPNNMFIWATMNSADQGVFPMDTAFKRRWDFEYIGIDEEESSIKNRIIELDVLNGKQYINWNRLRKAINDCIAINKINEDKQLGPFFISKKILGEEYDDNNKDKTLIKSKVFEEVFKDKVLMYIFEDVFKSKPMKIFNDVNHTGIYRYSEICDNLKKIGLKIFCIDGMDKVFTMDKTTIKDILDD